MAAGTAMAQQPPSGEADRNAAAEDRGLRFAEDETSAVDLGSYAQRSGLDDRARQEKQQREAQAISPSGRAKAQKSKTEFAGQDRAEALATLDGAFPEIVNAPPFDPLRLRDGDELMGYTGMYSAKVDGRQGGAQIVQSQLPMRSRAGGDGLKPVSYDMEATGTTFRPGNPLVKTVINKDLDEGIEFPDLNYTVRPSGASSTSEPMRVGDKVLYANLVEDTDLFITPSPTGIATVLHVRSEQAPERVALQFSFTAGQRLELIDGAQAGVGVRILDADGLQLAQIPAPNAVAADGREVPTSYSLEEPNKLVISYPHKAKGFEYPLAVDPVIDNYTINPDGSVNTDYDPFFYWDFYSGDINNPFTPIKGNTSPSAWGNLRGRSGYGNGLYVYNRTSGQFYKNGTQGQWIWGAPGRSFIRRADFGYVTHTPGATCIVEGIWATSRGNWDSGHWDHPGGQPTPRGPSPFFGYQGPANANANSCDTFSNNYKAHHYDATASQPNPTPGNQVLFSLYANGDGARGQAIGYMYGASMYLDDADNPTLGAPQLANQLPGQACCAAGVPSGWVNGGTFGAAIDVADPGLGVKRTVLQGDGQNKKTREYPCSGGKDNRCPSFWPSSQNNIQYTAAEIGDGIHQLNLVGVDIIDHTSPASTSWQLKIDVTRPALQAEGYLFDAASALFAGIEYDFRAEATDATSGLASIELRDGTTTVVTQDCRSEKACSADLAYTPPDALGARTLTLVATDLAGNERTTSIPVVLAGAPEPPGADEAPDEDLVSDVEQTDQEDSPTELGRGYCGPDSVEPAQQCAVAEAPSQAERSVTEEPSLASGSTFPLNLGVLLQVGGTNRAAPVPGTSSDLNRAGRGWGLSDEKPNLFTLPAPSDNSKRAINDLSINRVRKIIAWDVSVRADSDRQYNAIESDNCGTTGSVTVPKSDVELGKLDAWFQELRRAERQTGRNYEPMISFELSKGSDGRMMRPFSRVRCALPTTDQYRDAVTAVLQRYRGRVRGIGRPRTFTAWNEPNGDSQPTRATNSGFRDSSGNAITGLQMAGKYYTVLRSLCRKPENDCTVAAGDLLDKSNLLSKLREYKKGIANRADDPPIVWALHPYGIVKNVAGTGALAAAERTRRLNRFINAAIGSDPSPKVWLTETGGLFTGRTETAGSDDFCKSINLAKSSNRVTRYYHYTLQGGDPFDTGLIRADGSARDLYERYAFYSAGRGSTAPC